MSNSVNALDIKKEDSRTQKGVERKAPLGASYVPPEQSELDWLTEVNDDLYDYFCDTYSTEKNKDFIPFHVVNHPHSGESYQFCFKPISDFMLNIAYKEMFENNRYLEYNAIILRNTLLNGEGFVFDENNRMIRLALEKHVQKFVTYYEVQTVKRKRTRRLS